MKFVSVCMTEDPTEKMMNNDTVVVTVCPGDRSHSELPLEAPSSLLTETKEFQWSKSLQGLLLSCFFYGYILTQIIGGYFSDKVRAGFMLPNAGCCCLSLVASQSSWWGC